MTTPVAGAQAFTPTDWFLLAATASMWGSSFIWMEIALRSFEPSAIALLRVLFGVGTLVLFPKARARVARADLPAIAALGVLWMGVPFILFPVAQQWIDSSVAGMINGAVPIFASIVAAIVLKGWPTPITMAGIAVGFVGVLAVSWPVARGAESSALGVILVLLATAMYGISINIAAPLQKRYGALPVLLRVQFVALGVTLVPGAIGLADSSFRLTSLLAIVPLGCLGTALAFVGMATLVGRVGPTRGSVTIYFVPVVAIVLGAVFENEEIATISLVGTVFVLLGAYLAGKKPQAGKAP